MLVLQRRTGQSIRIGEDIYITLVRIGPGSCRVGITAPKNVPIVREEIDPYAKPIETTNHGGEA